MKKRVISAAVLLAIVVPIVYVGGFYYYIGLSILSIFAYKEIISLPSLDDVPSAIKICGIVFFMPIVLSSLMSGEFNNINYLYLILLFVYLFVPTLFYKDDCYKLKDGMYLAALMIFIGIGFASMIYARESIYTFVYLISVPILSDTFAMLTGMLVGKHKLCPSISPNKTVEGSVGGFFISIIVPLIIYFYLIGDITLNVFFMTLALAMFSQIGDLIFSKIKRENNIKDFSNLIPGHGGVLDRVDSIMFVSIIYLIISSII